MNEVTNIPVSKPLNERKRRNDNCLHITPEGVSYSRDNRMQASIEHYDLAWNNLIERLIKKEHSINKIPATDNNILHRMDKNDITYKLPLSLAHETRLRQHTRESVLEDHRAHKKEMIIKPSLFEESPGQNLISPDLIVYTDETPTIVTVNSSVTTQLRTPGQDKRHINPDRSNNRYR